MKAKIFLLLILILSFVGFSKSQAAMSQDILGVNHQTKECAMFYAGDECETCVVPDGFVQIPLTNGEYICPDGYTLNNGKYSSVCTSAKGGFCCEESHSGSSGDCEDVIVNHKTKKCGVVDDINMCKALETDWERAPQDDFGVRYCPYYSEWQDISCPTFSGNNFSDKFQRDLKLGDSGEDVKALQQVLNSIGFKIAETGLGSQGNETNYFGLLTQKAVIKFQIENKIYPTAGYFGPKTRTEILKYTQLFGQ